MTSNEQAAFTIRLLYGPPRPVRVVSVVGEVDRSNEAELFVRLGITADRLRVRSCDARGETLRVSSTVVMDLRRVSFVAAGTIVRLGAAADRSGLSLRLVLDPASSIGRTLERLIGMLDAGLDVRHDLVDAVLADVAVLD